MKTKKVPAKLSENAIPIRSYDIVSRRNPDGTVSVLHMNNERYYLNIYGPATEVWSLVNGENSVKEIMARVSRKFGVPVPEISKSVTKFLSDLNQEEILSFES